MPTFGSLFAGIGGIDLGLERAGWTGRWQVEWDAYCTAVLAKHWPDIPRYSDITKVDWSQVEPVDLIAGGFPCQPVSVAGKQLRQLDDRWLWPEFARAVRALRPRLVLVENVPGLLAGGMGDVLGDLATLGYDAEWSRLSAADVGAPHLRERVFVVGYADAGQRRTSGAGEGRAAGLPLGASRTLLPWREMAHTARHGWDPRWAGHAAQESGGRQSHRGGSGTALADTTGERLERLARSGEALGPCDTAADGCGQAGEPLDGRVGNQWSVEPDVGRVAHGVPARVDRLRALGNAVVPQVVEVIGRRLLKVMVEGMVE